jgi:membrane associated rhomboid family serine protease
MLDISTTPVTILLLGLNVLISAYALFSDPSLISKLAFKPREIREGKEYQRLITAGFVHVNVSHLAFNMITLFFFGPWMETILGPARFLLLYFGSEMAAHALSLKIHWRSNSYAAVGASGAISGVLFGFCLFAPFELLYLFLAIPIPAIVFAVGYVALSIYSMRQAQGQGMTGGIAHEAHLGGALGGVILTIILYPDVIRIFLSNFGL